MTLALVLYFLAFLITSSVAACAGAILHIACENRSWTHIFHSPALFAVAIVFALAVFMTIGNGIAVLTEIG